MFRHQGRFPSYAVIVRLLALSGIAACWSISTANATGIRFASQQALCVTDGRIRVLLPFKYKAGKADPAWFSNPPYGVFLLPASHDKPNYDWQPTADFSLREKIAWRLGLVAAAHRLGKSPPHTWVELGYQFESQITSTGDRRQCGELYDRCPNRHRRRGSLLCSCADCSAWTHQDDPSGIPAVSASGRHRVSACRRIATLGSV